MNKNKKLLESFSAYCKQNSDQRFWQALRNWSGAGAILAMKAESACEVDNLVDQSENLCDTFYLGDVSINIWG